ncbi:MAG: hypothetical protein ACE366_27365 [Bradymonadia bacterium]
MDYSKLDNVRQFRRGADITVVCLDYCQVLRRTNDGEWQDEECNWEGEAEDTFEEWCDALLDDGWTEEVVEGLPSLAERLEEKWGALPAVYRAFLNAGRNVELAEHVFTGVPMFASDHVLWADIVSNQICDMDFCGLNPEKRYVPISRDIYDAHNRDGDPHSLFLAVDRSDPQAPVMQVSPGGIFPAFATFEAFIASMRPPEGSS